MNDAVDSHFPNPAAAWQLWHSDLLDSDSPPTLQSSGTDIVQGLYELWLYTLKEAILDSGNASFSRFHLTCGNTPRTRVDVHVDPFDNLTLLKIRRWAGLMSQDPRIDRHAEGQRDTLIMRLANLHDELLQTSSRRNASAIDWSAEARELLALVERISDPTDL